MPLGSPEAAEIARKWLLKLDGTVVTVEKGSVVGNRFEVVASLARFLGWPNAVADPLDALADTQQPPGELSALGVREKRIELVRRVKIAVRAYAALVKRRVDGTR